MVLHMRGRRLVWLLCVLVVVASVLLSSLAADRRRPTDTAPSGAVPVVTVDAGHGGFDGGATAADGTQEKDINLAVALPMADFLRLCGVRVVMTRTDDEALCEEEGLRIRDKKRGDMKARLALFEEADLNVSIHQNAFSGTAYSGTQVFYTVNHPDAARLAQCVQSQVMTWLQPDNTRQIKSGNRDIYLLHKTTVPTILVECGFLSNIAECEALKSAIYQRQMAWALTGGVLQFLTTAQGGETG